MAKRDANHATEPDGHNGTIRRPSFQFYPSDEEREIALRLVGLTAYGLWKRMQNIMHVASPYGFLTTSNGTPLSDAQLALAVGASPAQVRRELASLESNDVFSRDDQGRIFCRRMVRDEHLRNVRAAAGRLGGNARVAAQDGGSDLPSALLKQNTEQSVKRNGKQRHPPSSSPSSASSPSTALQQQQRRAFRGGGTNGKHPAWWTPFDAAWRERCGGPLPGRAETDLASAIETLAGDVEEALARWEYYLLLTDPRYCSASRFAATLGEYADRGTVTASPPMLPDAVATRGV